MSPRAWIAALCYFVTYIPFAYLSGRYPANYSLTALGVALTMCLVWTIKGFWSRIYFDWRVFFCGLFNTGIIASTIISMSMKMHSVFKTALVNKGSVLMLAPYADKIAKNKIFTTSIIASGLAAIGVVILNLKKFNEGEPTVPWELALCYITIVLCYAIKLPLFSVVKRMEERKAMDFLVSHQTISVIIFVTGTFYFHGFPKVACIPPLPWAATPMGMHFCTPEEVAHPWLLWVPLVLGFFSQLGGFFGSAILLSGEEHTATVPLKTVGAMTAGLIAAALLSLTITGGQVVGFIFMLAAVGVLSLRKRGTKFTCLGCGKAIYGTMDPLVCRGCEKR